MPQHGQPPDPARLADEIDGIDFNMAAIPDDYDEQPTEMFNPVHMRKLVALGKKMARAGYPWAKRPPGF